MKWSAIERYPAICEDPVIRGKLFYYPHVHVMTVKVCMATGRTKALPVPTDIEEKEQRYAVYYEVLIGESVDWVDQKALKLAVKK